MSTERYRATVWHRTLSRGSVPGFALFLLGVVAFVFRDVCVPILWSSLHKRVYNEVVWLPGVSEETEARFNRTVDRVHAFVLDVTNVEDVRWGGSVPRVKKRGPYVFEKHTSKVGVEWSEDEGSLSFRDVVEYVYLPGASNGSLDDTVTTVNVPLLGVLEMIIDRYSSGGDDGNLSRMLQYVAHVVERWREPGVIQGVFMKRSVGELLLGYTDGLLEVLSSIFPEVDPRFAVLRARDGEGFGDFEGPGEGAVSEQRTGKAGLEEVAQLVMWRGKLNINAWKSPELVRGTEGRQFTPGIKEKIQGADSKRQESVWVADAYRAFEVSGMERRDMVRTQDIDGASFPLNIMRLTPDRASFAASPKYWQEYSGLINISSPVSDGRAGPKLFLSLPDFCGVDVLPATSIGGISCPFEGGHVDDALGSFIHLDVEPISGLTVRAKKSLLLSSWISPRYKSIDAGIGREAFVPLVELRESGSATGDQLRKLRKLQSAVGLCIFSARYMHWVSGLMIVVGLIAMMASMGSADDADDVHERDEESEALHRSLLEVQ